MIYPSPWCKALARNAPNGTSIAMAHVRNMQISGPAVMSWLLKGSEMVKFMNTWRACSSECLESAISERMEDSLMQYTPGRVYRHKSLEAQRYADKLHRREVLLGAMLAGCSLLISISFLVMFVKWWLV